MAPGGRAVLADGSECVFDIYEGMALLEGRLRRIAVDEASTAPLVGMALLHGYELNVQVQNGGSVTIKALRSTTAPDTAMNPGAAAAGACCSGFLGRKKRSLGAG